MKKIIIFCLALFLVLNLPSTLAQGQSQGNTGYGGGAPSYEEEYETEISYGGGGSSGYGGGGSSSYGGGGSGGYTPPPEEHYEEHYNSYGGYGGNKPSYEEEYETNTPVYGGYGSTPTYETEVIEEMYETPSYGYGGTPTYNNAANETYTSEYEEAYASGGGSSSGGGGTKPNVPFVPTSLLTGFVVDIHFLAGDPRFQYIAYHYCADLYPGYTQCDIYNGTESNSRLVATEIVVSADIFAQLPMEERKYWHSHAFAVKSGLLVSPNTPADQDLQVMSSVMNSYGKVTDFWHSYQNFPYGGAKLAYGLAEQSQINETIANQLDSSLGLSTTWQERARARASLNPTIIEGADAYLTTGEYPQYITQMFPVAGGPGSNGESGEVAGGAVEEGGQGGSAEGEVGGIVAEENAGAENGEISSGETGQESENGNVENGSVENGENTSISILPEDFGEESTSSSS